MAELSLILTLDLAALATAGWANRWLSRLSLGDKEDQRLTRALRSAADGLARRQLTQLLWSALILVSVNAALAWLLGRPAVLWFGVGAAAGSLACWSLGQIALSFSLNAASLASRVSAASDSPVVVGMRAASTAVLLSQTAALASGAGLLLFTLQGGLAEHPVVGVCFVGGVVSGSLFAALFTLLGGSSLRVAGVMSRRGTPQSVTHPFYWVEPRNPSLILDLVSGHAGVAPARAQTVFCVTVLLQLICILLPPGIMPGGGGNTASATVGTTLAALLCAQAASLVSSGLIQLTLRADDSPRSWVNVLWRGQLASGVLAVFSVGGAVYWLIPSDLRATTVVSASAGVTISWMISALSSRTLGLRSRRLEERPESTRRSVLDLGSGLQATFMHAPLFLAILGVALVVPWSVSSGFGNTLYQFFWLTVGALTALPFVAAQGLLEPILEATSSLVSLRQEGLRPEPQSHLAGLCVVANQAANSAQRFLCITTGLVACLCLGILLAPSQQAAAPTSLLPSVSGSGAQLWILGLAALSGMGLVLLTIGAFARQAIRTAHTGLSEIQRQLRTQLDAEPGVGPTQAKPGYAVYLEQTSTQAFSRAALVSSWLPISLVALWFVLTQLPDSQAGSLLRVVSFLAFAAASGIIVSLLGGGVASYLGVTRGFRRVSSGSPDAMANAMSGLAELSGTALAPAALVLVNVSSALCLTLPSLLQ